MHMFNNFINCVTELIRDVYTKLKVTKQGLNMEAVKSDWSIIITPYLIENENGCDSKSGLLQTDVVRGVLAEWGIDRNCHLMLWGDTTRA